MFRISTAGMFIRLHRFCGGAGCENPVEGTVPTAHLVQMPNGALCGTTSTGVIQNNGTVFCASTSGSVNTIYGFQPSNGTDGADPVGASLVGTDGQTLYETTTFGFYVPPDTTAEPECALIFGTDGKLYGTTYEGNPAGIFSLNTDGTGFSSQNVFDPNIVGRGYESTSGLLLAGNDLMYGTTYAGGTGDGTLYSYNLAEAGSDSFLYTTNTFYGGSDKLGTDAGSIVRLGPALK